MKIVEGILIVALVKLLQIEYAEGASDEQRSRRRKTNPPENKDYGFLQIGLPTPSNQNLAALEGPVYPPGPPAKKRFNPNAAHAEGSTRNQMPYQLGLKPNALVGHNLFPVQSPTYLIPSSSSAASSSSDQNVKSDVRIEENSDLVIRLSDHNDAVGSIESSRLRQGPLPEWLSTRKPEALYQIYILAPSGDYWIGTAAYLRHVPVFDIQHTQSAPEVYPLSVFVIPPKGSQLYTRLTSFDFIKKGLLFEQKDKGRTHIFIKNTNGEVYKGKLSAHFHPNPALNLAKEVKKWIVAGGRS